MNKNNYQIMSYENESWGSPKSIERLSDKQVFNVGDHVTNGTQMHGKITRFERGKETNDLYVYTDWSNVGMNLSSVKMYEKLPSKYQIGDHVHLYFGECGAVQNLRIKKVNFGENGFIGYDVELFVDTREGKKISPRLHNIAEGWFYSAK